MNLSCLYISYVHVFHFSHYLYSISSLYLSLFLFFLSIILLSPYFTYFYFLCLYGNKLCILWPINFETLKLETVYYSQCFFSLYLFYICSILSYTMYFDYKIGFHGLLERPSNVNKIRSPLNLLFLFSLQISPS